MSLFRKIPSDELPYCSKCGEVKTRNTICKKCREELGDIETNMKMKYMDIEKRAIKNKQYKKPKEDDDYA